MKRPNSHCDLVPAYAFWKFLKKVGLTGPLNRPTKPTTLVISGAMIIAEMQHLSNFPQRKNSDATRNGNDASYFH